MVSMFAGQVEITSVGTSSAAAAETQLRELNERLEIIVEAQADVCSRRSVPFVDCYYPLSEHDQWLSELSSSRDGRHPGQAGYGLLAWLVLHGGWESWLQISP